MRREYHPLPKTRTLYTPQRAQMPNSASLNHSGTGCCCRRARSAAAASSGADICAAALGRTAEGKEAERKGSGTDIDASSRPPAPGGLFLQRMARAGPTRENESRPAGSHAETAGLVADAAMMIKPKVLYPCHFGGTDTSELVDLLEDQEDIKVKIRRME